MAEDGYGYAASVTLAHLVPLLRHKKLLSQGECKELFDACKADVWASDLSPESKANTLKKIGALLIPSKV